MILIHRLTSFSITSYKNDFLECLNNNLNNPAIKSIVIFIPHHIDLPKNQKIRTFLVMDLSDFDIINRVKSLFKNKIYLFSNPFIKFNNTLSNLEKIECIPLSINESCIAFNNTVVLKRGTTIDSVFERTPHLSKNVKVDKKHFWSEEIKIESKKKESESIIKTESIIINQGKQNIPDKRLDIITVSINYNDVLILSLSKNINQCKNITVITTPEDILCHKICEKFGVKCVISETLYDRGLLNKGRAINDAISTLENPEWVLLLDADICLPKDFIEKFNNSNLDSNTLYVADRKICKNKEDFDKWSNNQYFEGQVDSKKGFGYFHLFNTSHFNSKRPHPEFKGLTSDINFRNLFFKRDSLDIQVIHLGETVKNWKGRITENFISNEQIEKILDINLIEKNTDSVIFKKNIRDLNIKPKLAVITSFFNPNNYINIKYNYLIFSKKIKEKCDLFPIELSFNGEFFIEDENVIRIVGDSENILWQKERLLNIALERLPEEYTNVAWIDCDVIFENPNWVDEVNQKLSEYKVVQIFETAKRLDRKGDIGLISNGFIKRAYEIGTIERNFSKGIPGFGWAMRREVIDKVKFIDTQVVGGADALMMFAYFGIKDTLFHNKMNLEWKEECYKWADITYKEINSSVGYISGSIIHLYHGDIKNRRYDSRYSILSSTSFNPVQDLEINSNGLWKFKNQMISENLQTYFEQRYEDDNIIDINSYFDNIYVLNLNRRPDRWEKIEKKLNDIGIKYERFSAIDGNYLIIDNDFSNFRPGTGMIENKYAYACLLSHIEIVKDAKEKGYKRILIFEDDVLISKDIKVHLQKLRKIKDWKLLYLGASQYRWNLDFIEDFYYSKNSLGTFAYAIDESVYNDILQIGNTKSIDNYLAEIQLKYYGNCFTFYPNICISDVSESEIREKRNQEEHSKKMRWDISKSYE
jgi:GR25 family glycosyltransferase involved in LPS biosynthesis